MFLYSWEEKEGVVHRAVSGDSRTETEKSTCHETFLFALKKTNNGENVALSKCNTSHEPMDRPKVGHIIIPAFHHRGAQTFPPDLTCPNLLPIILKHLIFLKLLIRLESRILTAFSWRPQRLIVYRGHVHQQGGPNCLESKLIILFIFSTLPRSHVRLFVILIFNKIGNQRLVIKTIWSKNQWRHQKKVIKGSLVSVLFQNSKKSLEEYFYYLNVKCHIKPVENGIRP